MFLLRPSRGRLTSRDEMEFRIDAAQNDVGLQTAAGALSLVRTGVRLDIGLDEMANHLAQLAELHGLDPDALQRLLVLHEPVLATDNGLAL